MSLGWRAGALLLTIALLASTCGGHGAEHFGDTNNPNPSQSPGPTGGAALIEFVAPGSTTGTSDSTVFQASIGPSGSSNPQASLVQFRVLNSDGRPAKNGIRVIFSLEGATDAKLGQTKDKTSNGFVSTVVQAGSISGIVVVVARVDGTNLIARSAVITIGHEQGQAVAIEFFGLRVPGLLGTGTDNAGTPTTRTQLGVRGSGFAQSVDVVFVVLDQFGGAAADGTIIDFNLFGPNGGEAIAPTSVPTNKGFVSATITTGTRPGPVEVTARVRGTGIFARAIPITIGTALNPPATHLSIAAKCLNVAGSVTFGLEDEIRAGLSDQFGNQLPLGSAVSFFTEGGGIVAQGISADGLHATANLVTQLPIPADHRVTVMAVTTGQEPFTDLNGNGQFDPGEPFTDLSPEPFLDANENGQYDVGEFFIDNNNNGVRDNAGNGQWDDQILISVSGPIVFSGHAQATIMPRTFMLGPGESETFTVTVADEAGQPLVAGTTIKFTGVNVTVTPAQYTLADTDLMPGPNVTEFTVTLTNPVATPAPAPSGGSPGPAATPAVLAASLTVDVTSGSGSGGGSSTQCPGSNGSATDTVNGTVVQ
jgi:hypothetical protein